MTKKLSELDRSLLESDSSIKWIPPNPEELLLPYVDQTQLTDEEKTDLEKRRAKGKEVYEQYSNIISECKELENQISDRCKKVSVEIKDRNQLNVLEALGRVFGFGVNKITFDMYKQCIQELEKINQNNVPSPEGL